VTPRVLVRCDATRDTGLGHVSRCLALAEALAELGVASIFCGEFDGPARRLLEEAGTAIRPGAPAEQVAQLVRERACGGVIVDGYRFDATYLEALAPGRTGSSLLVVDDFAGLANYPDGAVVLNFTVGAGELEFNGRDLVRLLGPGYLLVRRALRVLRARGNATSRPPQRVLVAMGGGDPLELSVDLASALKSASPEVAVRLTPGWSGPAPEGVESIAYGQLAPSFAWADLCVTGGGLTKYEAAYVGVPPLVVSHTDRELAETQYFAQAGLGVDAGHGGQLEPHALANMLVRYVRDDDLHDRLRRAAAAVFPDDPTARAAQIYAATLA
jgi:UDP-2,4-diacetamido-2,4,6-trideoxy-beta-L-altropyranose hydrolase